MKIIIELDCTVCKFDADIMIEEFEKQPYIKKAYLDDNCSYICKGVNKCGVHKKKKCKQNGNIVLNENLHSRRM